MDPIDLILKMENLDEVAIIGCKFLFWYSLGKYLGVLVEIQYRVFP